MAADPARIQFRRGDESNRGGITPADGEPLWTNGPDYDEKRLWIGDGTQPGGRLPAAHADPHPGNRSTYYYRPASDLSAPVTAAAVAHVVIYSPIFLGGTHGVPLTLSSVSVNIVGNAVGNLRLGIYSNVRGAPVARLGQSGNISTNTTGLRTWSASLALNPGWYWMAFATDTSTPTYSCTDNIACVAVIGDTVGTGIPNLWYEILFFGANPLPSTATPVYNSADAPRMVAAVA